jgi:cellobiose phosphorylase
MATSKAKVKAKAKAKVKAPAKAKAPAKEAYGYFDRPKKEYVITRPDTPLPWINYLGTDQYCALFSHTAGGYSFYKDASQRRITRYRYNNIPLDANGKYIYLRDDETGEHWSTTWQPTRQDPKKYKYECRVGLSYNVIKSEYKGIATEGTYFVPEGETLEVWRVRVTNTGKKPRKLTAVSFVEFCLWDALNDMTDFQYNLNIAEMEVDKKSSTLYHLSRYRVYKDHYAYFSVNRPMASFDTEREQFLGPWGSLESPQSVREGKGKNTIASDWSPVGSHQVKLTIKPGATEELIYVLGFGFTKGDREDRIAHYKKPANVQAAFDKLAKTWAENMSRFQCETPDEDVNLMAGTWNQYQCRTTFNWSRSASYYESGIGRGMGFRDSNQDTMGFVYQVPEKVRQRLIDLASTQFADGSARHQYQPLTGKGNGFGFSDDHLWQILSTASYLRETADLGLLNEKVPYDDGSKSSYYEHLSRAMAYSWDNCGPHGLPKIFKADWNDCMNLDQGKVEAGKMKECRSESVMVAQMFVKACRDMQDISRWSGRPADTEFYRERGDEMAKRIERAAWDGDWYIRAFTEEGAPVGSKAVKKGSIIHLNSQSWSVYSGAAQGEHGRVAMDSVKKLMATEHGIVLNYPAYNEYDKTLGAITIFPPGLKENGAIFCHPNPWAMIAECMLGRGEQALEYYKAILPAARNRIAHIHRTEPYVYAQMIAGKESPKFGQAKNSWLTWTAAWNFIAISQYILGCRADFDGLVIDPCIPKQWKGFSLVRKFRGAEYRISIKNPKGVSKGVASMVVDGKPLKGNKAPVFHSGVHLVEVVMG